MTYTQSICETCGTDIIRDEETLAEAHFDVTYRNCGVEGELERLAQHIDGTRPFPSTPRLRVVKYTQ